MLTKSTIRSCYDATWHVRAPGQMEDRHLWQSDVRPALSRTTEIDAPTCCLACEKRSRCCGRKGWAFARSLAIWADQHPRCRGKCDATPRRKVATLITRRSRRSDTRSELGVARNLRSWSPTRRCGRMCRNGWPAPWLLRAVPRCLTRW